LREVGTTNRTKLGDYENAINDSTRLILRVHPSNYRIIGFTEAPSLKDLTDLAHKHGLMLYEDLGSGALIDLSGLGLRDEPIVSDSIAAGVDVVSFSGDKLLGGPQAGIIAGKLEALERLRSHPLYRALRVDKLTYGALEATLDAYRRGSAFTEIPVLKMLSATRDHLILRAQRFSGLLNNPALHYELVDGFSAIGGGAAAGVELATKLIALRHTNKSATALEQELRREEPPVIARIVDGRVMLDLRTVPESDEDTLLAVLNQIV
jgi:L-seryl-tRNA(Ser) seleniumtransferase